MRSGLNKCAIVISMILLSHLVFAGGDSAQGQKKSTTCAACHGATGKSNSPIWPNLAGQGEKYLYQQLIAFKKSKEGGRNSTTMTPLVSNLSDQDLQDLAAFYAAQPVASGVADKKLLARGQEIYRGGDIERNIVACIACHGPQGLGNNEAAFPVLSGQKPDYIVTELTNYKNATRTTDPNNIMQDIASKMTNEDMKAVANYVSGLH